LKIATWDCEAWDLSPEFAPLLCVSIEDVYTKKMTTFRNDKYVKAGKADGMADDHALVVDARDFIEQFDMTYGWYSKGYDFQLLNTRLSKWGERLLIPHWHIDGTWYFRGWRGVKPKSSKLKHVAEFYGIEQKPEVPPDVWLNARGGQKKAMDIVVDRCEADVRITRQCVERAIRDRTIKTISRYP
jgi:hypothetical protein